MGYLLVKQPPTHCRRVFSGAGVLRVSSKLDSSHRTLTTPVEAYAPPHTVSILPSCESPSSMLGLTPKQHATAPPPLVGTLRLAPSLVSNASPLRARCQPTSLRLDLAARKDPFGLTAHAELTVTDRDNFLKATEGSVLTSEAKPQRADKPPAGRHAES